MMPSFIDFLLPALLHKCSFLGAGKGGFVDGYEVQRSVRLRSAASAYFSRTFGAPTSATTWTYKLSIKRGSFDGYHHVLYAEDGSSTYRMQVYFQPGGTLAIVAADGGAPNINLTSARVFRDCGVHFSLQIVLDGDNAVSSERVRVYADNERVAMSGTYPYLGYFSRWSKAGVTGWIGKSSSGEYFDGYISEVNFIDGQALTPASFGELDPTTRQWVPKKYTGTYGANGFYLDFSDITSTTTLGYDKSGNGNNWTANNISLTADASYDSMLDVPGRAWADGGNGRGNYCVLSSVFKNADATYGVMATPSAGNLTAVMGAGTNVYGSIGLVPSAAGDFYAECRPSSLTSQVDIGLMSSQGNINRSVRLNSANGIYVDNASQGTTGILAGDVVGIAVSTRNNTVVFYRNGSQLGGTYSLTAGSVSEYLFWAYTNSGVTVDWNFGQRPFAYTPPTGYKALHSGNMAAPTGAAARPWEHFDVSLFVGAAGNVNITGIAFQPDLIWAKSRSNAQGHELIDSVRGATKLLQSNTTSAELTLTNPPTFNSDGWTSTTDTHTNGYTYAAWQWKAGGAAVANNAGSIASQVSANVAAGFSVVTFICPASGNFTIGHGLGATPAMIICKSRSTPGNHWPVWHKAFPTPTTNFVQLDSTVGQTSSATIWGGTSPTSSVITFGTNAAFSPSDTAVAYCFAEIPGYSKFGSYTGNGSADGPFVYCGFRPKWVLVKRTDSAQSWYVRDSARNAYNVVDLQLYPDLANAEATEVGIDFTANGFKLRGTSVGFNASGGTYIFAAFAEAPFQYANAR